jgi:L-asparaginase
MQDILIINTGGTFNKIYNKISGNLDVDKKNLTLKEIEKSWLCRLNYISIINKDSLEFTNSDRDELLEAINKANYSKIVVIHGTDTIDISAKFISSNITDKTVVFTGAMVPFSIDKIEATANLSLALGFCKMASCGVYIAINGVADRFDRVVKNRELGAFELK